VIVATTEPAKKTLPGLADASASPFPMHDVPRCGCCGSDRWSSAGTRQGLELRSCDSCHTVRYAAVVDHAHIYDDGYHTGENPFGWHFDSERPYQLALAHETMEWLDARVPMGRMVDVGGGVGYFAAIAAERGWDATLLEPVPGACEFAEKTFGIRAIPAGAEALAELDERFELVTLIHALEHFLNPLEILDQVRVAVAPRGALYVEVPNFGSAAHRLQKDGWYGLQVGQHVHHFTRRTLRAVLERAGYEVLVLETKVPGWSGLIPTAYAHWLGLTPALNASVTLKRRLFGRSAAYTAQRHNQAHRNGHANGNGTAHGNGNANGAAASEMPAPIDQLHGPARLVFGTGFAALARVEESLNLGTNLRLLARRRP
jgi:2-polyprenyl-3-methyl-5-hydroxy-6-metoxy-1,4-benzoquinol methylase